jgi:hypothetical protein
MQSLEGLHDLRKVFSNQADFLCVYLAEAHSTDEWPVGVEPKLLQATNLPERAAAAKSFVASTKFNWPVACDNMKNEFLEQFGAWPVRFFVLQDNKCIFKSMLDKNYWFDVSELKAWLAEHLQNVA